MNSGWLFDAYAVREGIVLWFIDTGGRRLPCLSRFAPSFFLRLNERDTGRAEEIARRDRLPVTFGRARQKDLYSNETLDVLEVIVHDAARLRRIVAHYERFFPHFVFFNADILAAQMFLYRTGLFPLAFCGYEIDPNGELAEYELRDDAKNFEYELPPLVVMRIRSANDSIPPKYRRTIELEVSYDGRTYALEHSSEAEMLHAINRHLRDCDPDIVLSRYGDSVLMPRITAAARRLGIPMLFNRDTAAEYKVSRESSFFQYGKIIHKDGAFEFRGRWHVDEHNSFMLRESNMDGLFEITRVTQLCPQHQARASIGTGLSSLQLGWAYRNGYLIPARKREPEEFKPASLLMLADRGGLTYRPPHGYHDDIAELDFVSMYPSIMVNNNVSPETVNCRCCSNAVVPELGYSICERRTGIIPATLKNIVERRGYYKAMRKRHKGSNQGLYHLYDNRQNALKWILVCCFGYLGYKNARFGRIEAHESVNAFSRDAILIAKEIAEERGFEMIHGIIDCLWLKKPGATEDEYNELCRTVRQMTGIDISLEGIYRWIVFPTSKTDNQISAGTRYVGAYRHDELKQRGIEARRRDTPELIKEMQAAMLERMRPQCGGEAVRAIVPELLDIAGAYIDLIRGGQAPPLKLVLRRSLSKEADEYMNNSVSAVVSRMLEESGVHLSAGESVSYIMLDHTGKRRPEKAKPVALYALEDGYDPEFYLDLAFTAVETLLSPFGWDVEQLRKRFLAPTAQKPAAGKRKTPGKHAGQYNLALEFI